MGSIMPGLVRRGLAFCWMAFLFSLFAVCAVGGASWASTTPQVIDGGGDHTLAVGSDGTAWAWGYNGYGQLGDGTTTQRNTPVQVSGLSGAIAVAAGGYHSLTTQVDWLL